MYRYETHLHTSPVSRCADASVRESLEFYKSLGYDGVFITNHFLDGNVNISEPMSYEDKIHFYFSDYEEGARLAEEIGIKVFAGVELSYGGTDFLIYGLDKAWYLAHPEIMEMKKSEELPFMMAEGALVIQAHPYREAGYIDHIRLYPGSVQGVEIVNASGTDLTNEMAAQYAKAYGLLTTGGSDNHHAGRAQKLAGVECARPIESEADFVKAALAGELSVFTWEKE